MGMFEAVHYLHTMSPPIILGIIGDASSTFSDIMTIRLLIITGKYLGQLFRRRPIMRFWV